MKLKRWIGILMGLALISVNIGCDQLTKSIVRNEISPSEQIPIISDYLTLTNVENAGAFLSMGQAWWQPVKTALLIILPILVLLGGMYFMIRLESKRLWLTFALSFAIGGGIGNMIDRVLYGSVTDFLHVKIGPFQTGIFNMADVSIMIGIGLLLLFSMTYRREKFLRGLGRA